jgi:predicted GNAT family acetyltransferase
MDVPRPGLAEDCRKSVELAHREGLLWLLTEAGRPVASTAYNARVTRPDGSPETVQVGGVWTPVELRGRGYARCAVAGQLLESRGQGATRAVLFTGEDRMDAQAAYRALGFEPCGDYGLIFFADPPSLHT